MDPKLINWFLKTIEFNSEEEIELATKKWLEQRKEGEKFGVPFPSDGPEFRFTWIEGISRLDRISVEPDHRFGLISFGIEMGITKVFDRILTEELSIEDIHRLANEYIELMTESQNDYFQLFEADWMDTPWILLERINKEQDVFLVPWYIQEKIEENISEYLRHAIPEGPIEEWIEILKALKENRNLGFRRVSFLIKEDVVMIYSPCNAYDDNDYVYVSKKELIEKLEKILTQMDR